MGSFEDDVSVSTLDMWGLPPTMFHKDKEWKSFLIHFKNFAEHPTTMGQYIESPEFMCNRHKWALRLYPEGHISSDSDDGCFLFSNSCCFSAGDMPNSGYISLYLHHCSSEKTTATIELKIINKFGDTLETRRSSNNRQFDSHSINSVWNNVMKLSDILEESTNMLDSDGTFTVVISMKSDSDHPFDESDPFAARNDVYLDHLPSEPSWMKSPVIVGTLSNEGVEEDDIDFPLIDCCSKSSVDDQNFVVDTKESNSSVRNDEECRITIRDSWTDPSLHDSRDDEIADNGCSFKDEVSVSTLDMWGLPSSTFHDGNKEWKSFLIHFHNFAEHPTTKGQYLESPEFTCNGQKWALRLYPGGNTCSDGDGYVSLYLNHCSRGATTATFEVKMINKFGDILQTRRSSENRLFDSDSSSSGWSNIIKLSDVLDESKDILDSSGMLTVVVSMKEDQSPAEKALVLKKLVVKCLLRNQLLPENTIIGSRGSGKVLRLQRDASLKSLGGKLPKSRDPPQEGSTSIHHSPLTNFSAMKHEGHMRTLQSPSYEFSRQPPRPEEVRYQLPVCTAPAGNDLYSQKTMHSVPGQYYVGERGLSSHAMNRRRYYKEMLLQQQLAQTQAQLATVQRQLAAETPLP